MKFTDRLALARKLREATSLTAEVLKQDPGLVGVMDQVKAADVDARGFARQVSRSMTRKDPNFTMQEQIGVRTTPQMMDLMVACMMGCEDRCPHHGILPMIAVLAYRYLGCQQCVIALMASKAEPSTGPDQCDFCEDHGHIHFWPTMVTSLGVTFMGDACDACHDKMVEEVNGSNEG